MKENANHSTNTVSPADTSPPDWDMVPFAVGCARCGQDLRSLTEPVCPACELDFSWADAVPIEQLTCLHCGYHLYGLQETRCPECGERFTWEKVLDDYRRRKKPLFEYRWREEPMRSVLASFSLSWRPWKLWRMIDIHDPPATKTLVVLIIITAMGYALTPLILAYPGLWILHLIETFASVSLWTSRYYPFYTGPWGNAMLGWKTLPYVYIDWAAMVAAGAVGFAMLLVLRQSMQRCKVRNTHVFRAYVYAIIPVATRPLLWCIATFVVDAWGALRGESLPWLVEGFLRISIGGLTLFWMLMSLAIAYRRYLKTRHAWGVAFMSVLVAGICFTIVDIQLQSFLLW